MSVRYSLTERPNPRDPGAPKKFYATIKSVDSVTLRQLVEEISVISTVSSIDTLAVLEALLKVIPNHLLDGRIVRLGEFGTFRVTLESEGADTAEDFTSALIKRANMKFRPGSLILDLLRNAKFEKA